MIEVVGYSLDEAINKIRKYNPNIRYNVVVYTAPYCNCEYDSTIWDKRIIRQRYVDYDTMELTVSYFKKS